MKSAVEEAVQCELASQAEAIPGTCKHQRRLPTMSAALVVSMLHPKALRTPLNSFQLPQFMSADFLHVGEASVGGDGHSAAVDADVALLAHRSVQEVLSAVAQRSEAEQPPAVPEQPAEVQPSQPVAPAQPELPVTLEQPVAPEQPVQQEEAPAMPEQPVEPVAPGGGGSKMHSQMPFTMKKSFNPDR